MTAAGLDRFADHGVDLLPARARQSQHGLRCPAGVAGLELREAAEKRLAQQHHVGLVADDHAGGFLVCELLVELESESIEKLLGLLEIADGQVYEDFAGHEV